LFETYDSIFNRRGDAYHRAMRIAPAARRKEFALAVESLELRRGELLCDVPSGGGYLVDFLELRLVAVDPAEIFARTWNDKRVKWHLAPLHQLPLQDAAVDALVSIAGLHHVDDWHPVLREMRRVLRPGGRLCILEVPVGAITDRFLNGFVDGQNSMGHEGRFVDTQFRMDLAATGFRIESDELCRYTWDFSSVAEMIEFVQLMFWLDKATPATVLEGVRDMLGIIENGTGCSMNWELQRIVAR
jgi:SAM-dependent methyltransferase